MSGVYERNRNVSEYEFFHNALKIRVEINKLMVSPSIVPKAYRFYNGVPTVETARSIVVNINKADVFYPNNSFNALKRREYLSLAVADCEQLLLDLQCLLEMGLAINVNRLETVVEMIDKEIALLKGARKNVRVTGKLSNEELIEAAEQELDRLRAL